MAGNLASGLRRRTQKGPAMAHYDRLPPPLRHWLAGAVLPWSPASALRVWRRAGDPALALERLAALERARLARDPISRAAAR